MSNDVHFYYIILSLWLLSIGIHSALQKQEDPSSNKIKQKQYKNTCIELLSIHKESALNQTKKEVIAQKIKKLQYDDCLTTLNPKYYWAQNMTHIIVKFQFLMSTSTSSCGQLLYQNKSVDHDSFQLEQYCIIGSQIVKYELFMKTYKNLNPYFCQWSNLQQNGVLLQCLKSPTPYFWPKIYSKAFKPMRKPKVWWQLQQKQDQSTQKYMGLLEFQDEDVQISKQVTKNKKYINGKHRVSQSNNKDEIANIEFYCNQGSPFFSGNWE